MERRDFLKKTLLFVGTAAVVRPSRAFASPDTFPTGVVYTRDNPGRWAGKEGGHVPKVDVAGNMVKVLTPHPMSEKHFIVRHTLVSAAGEVLGQKNFAGSDPKAESSYELPSGAKGTFYATSFCNLHDFWLTEFTV